jgi:hypothetical protein
MLSESADPVARRRALRELPSNSIWTGKEMVVEWKQ